jgi:hypothetical protein
MWTCISGNPVRRIIAQYRYDLAEKTVAAGFALNPASPSQLVPTHLRPASWWDIGLAFQLRDDFV